MAYSAKQLIKAKGGPSSVATRLALAPLTVRMWKHRNRVPRHAWPDIMREYPDITLAKLLQTEKAPAGNRLATKEQAA